MALISKLSDIALPTILIPSCLFYVKTPVLTDGRKAGSPAAGDAVAKLAQGMRCVASGGKNAC